MPRDIKQFLPIKNARYKQGVVSPRWCQKLFPSQRGKVIIYRSSYEERFLRWCENSLQVKYWGSECMIVPYFSPIDQRMHRYFPDFCLEMVDGRKIIVEIKPYNQTQKPLNQNSWAWKEYIKNMAKWQAVREFCECSGYLFWVLTEKTIARL